MKKKLLIAIASVIIVAAVIGIVIYAVIPKDPHLLLSAEDISVQVGDFKKISFSVNIEDASVTVKPTDPEIVEIQKDKSDFYVKGLACGETEIVLTARYKNTFSETQAKVTVTEMSKTPETNPGGESGGIKDPDDSKQDEKNPPEVNKPVLNINDGKGYTIDGNEIHVKIGEQAIISVSFEGNGMVRCYLDDSEKEVGFLGANSFDFCFNEAGIHTLKFVLNDTYSYLFTLIVDLS